ncbi:MAG: hypothetical protein AB1656_11715 [Candidatus Omnitrophota bacterium]
MNVPTSAEEWLELPEISVPPVDSKIYHVLKVGFALTSKQECYKLSIPAIEKEIGRCILPTCLIKNIDGKQVLHRCPLSLTEWAISTVALAQAGMNPLPCDIEFGIMGDRVYAEML